MLILCSKYFCGSGMFYHGSLSRIRPISHPGSGSKPFFIPDPGSYIKSGMQTYFFLAANAFRSKVIVKKIRVPRSGIRKKFNPDPGGKKAPDPDPQNWFRKITLVLTCHPCRMFEVNLFGPQHFTRCENKIFYNVQYF
jgi:hypothetical protein